MKVSIIIPAYNEEHTVRLVLQKVLANKLVGEIVVVNDGSTDDTLKNIKSVKSRKIKLLSKSQNQGKGAAVCDALKLVHGEIVIIQDADLEYDPDEYKKLIQPIVNHKADVVFGSRFVGSQPHRVLYFWHYVGNRLITTLTNIFTNLNLTDVETGYKAFTKNVARQLFIKEKRFGFEIEFTVKIARLKVKVYEVGVGYSGRNYAEGKKIGWQDGLHALWCLIKYSYQ